MTLEEILADLAPRIVNGDFLPFIGAGCSRDLLHGYDWHGITAATAEALGIPVSADGPGIAQQYEDRFGRSALGGFLHERLTISDFDDAKGTAQIALMEMHFPIYYSTNVDNVTEACYAKYGRRLNVVVDPPDLRKIKMGNPTLMKFHGSSESPDSLVWTTSHYERRRADREHFMHIRLRSDLLTHSLMFIGYSLSPDDAHVRNLLLEMQTHYRDAMRDSVLIGYGTAKADFSSYGVRVISTAELYPTLDPSTAFNQFLSDLGKEATKANVDLEITTLLTPSGPTPQMSISEYQLSNVEKACGEQSLLNAINTFREHLDAHMIPHDLEQRVCDLYCALCARATTAAEAEEVESALINLQFHDKKLYFKAYAETFAIRWIGGRRFMLLSHLPDEPATRMILIAMAAQSLKERNLPRNKRFADWVAQNARFGSEILTKLDVNAEAEIVAIFSDIFNGSPRENPLSREYKSTFPFMSFQEIHRSMLDSLPRKPRRPF